MGGGHCHSRMTGLPYPGPAFILLCSRTTPVCGAAPAFVRTGSGLLRSTVGRTAGGVDSIPERESQ